MLESGVLAAPSSLLTANSSTRGTGPGSTKTSISVPVRSAVVGGSRSGSSPHVSSFDKGKRVAANVVKWAGGTRVVGSASGSVVLIGRSPAMVVTVGSGSTNG